MTEASMTAKPVTLPTTLNSPTSDEARLPAIVAHASGFLYYVAITGITGTSSADAASVRAAVARLRRFTSLPIAVGFGIKTPAQAAQVALAADAAAVGSAVVDRLARNLDPEGRAKPGLVDAVLADIRALAAGVKRMLDRAVQGADFLTCGPWPPRFLSNADAVFAGDHASPIEHLPE